MMPQDLKLRWNRFMDWVGWHVVDVTSKLTSLGSWGGYLCQFLCHLFPVWVTIRWRICGWQLWQLHRRRTELLCFSKTSTLVSMQILKIPIRRRGNPSSSSSSHTIFTSFSSTDKVIAIVRNENESKPAQIHIQWIYKANRNQPRQTQAAEKETLLWKKVPQAITNTDVNWSNSLQDLTWSHTKEAMHGQDCTESDVSRMQAATACLIAMSPFRGC